MRAEPSVLVVGAFHNKAAVPVPETVSDVVPETLPDVAAIVVEPAAADVANPLLPAALLMVATPVEEELQVTEFVRFCVVLSEYLPVAVNC